MLLKDGADKAANTRLVALHTRVNTTVNQFWRDAHDSIDALHGESHAETGHELFKALTDVLMVVFPEEMVIEKMAAEAIKGIRDAAIAKADELAAASPANREQAVKDALRQKLADMASAADQSMQAAVDAGQSLIPGALNILFEVHPEYKRVQYGADASQWEGYLSDAIGIRDPQVADPSPHVQHRLWEAFRFEYETATAQLHFFNGMSTDRERLIFLVHDVEPKSNVHDFLVLVGADVTYWQERLDFYHEHCGSDVTNEIMVAEGAAMTMLAFGGA